MKFILNEEEKNRILGLHGSNLVMEQSNPKVTQIQTYLKGKGHDLGTSGPNKDGIDGMWGNKTLTAVKTEFGIELDDQGNVKGTAAGPVATDTPKPTNVTTPEKPTNVTTPEKSTELAANEPKTFG
jgi:hypothetical protein